MSRLAEGILMKHFGFQQSSQQENISNLFYKSLGNRLELEVNADTGNGTLSIRHMHEDYWEVIPVVFPSEDAVMMFMQAFELPLLLHTTETEQDL